MVRNGQGDESHPAAILHGIGKDAFELRLFPFQDFELTNRTGPSVATSDQSPKMNSFVILDYLYGFLIWNQVTPALFYPAAKDIPRHFPKLLESGFFFFGNILHDTIKGGLPTLGKTTTCIGTSSQMGVMQHRMKLFVGFPLRYESSIPLKQKGTKTRAAQANAQAATQ